MNILVPIKRVIDAYVKVRVNSTNTGVEDNKMSINPFDEIAIEEAVQLKEKGGANQITVVSIGPKTAQESLRTALALGADEAILIESDTELEPLNIAKVLQAIVKEKSADLVIMGKQSIDGDNNQTGQMLSALLAWPQATFASKLEIEDTKVLVTREIDGGLETISFNLPGIVTTDLRLNEPRYASLPNIMKAKRKPLDIRPIDSLGLTLTPRVENLSFDVPPPRAQGEMLDSVDALVDKLKNADKVL